MGLNIHLLNVAAFRFCVLEDACFRAKQTRTNSLSIAIGVPSKISGELFLGVMFFFTKRSILYSDDVLRPNCPRGLFLTVNTIH